MIVLHVTLIIFSVVSTAANDIIISEDDYNDLPPIFHIDNYNKCKQESKAFCRIHLTLSSLNLEKSSKVWKLIAETKKCKRCYDHSQLYYALCVNKTDFKNNSTALKLLSKTYSKKFQVHGLAVTVTDINCTSFEYRLRSFDVILLCFLVLYMFLLIWATYYHVTMKSDIEGNKYIILFSIWHNLTKIVKANSREKFCKLTCIQGIRFYTTVLIIFCHTFCSFAGGYIANTKYLEDIPLNLMRHSLRNLFVFLVQTFFLVSAWLLSYRTFTAFERDRNINSCKYAILTFVNRYLRIVPPVLLMVFLGSSIWIHGLLSGPLKPLYSDGEYLRCQKNWWINFLFLNNHYHQADMCYFPTWYLAADTQLYALSLFLLIIFIKFKKIRRILMASCLILGMVIPAVVTFVYNLDFIYRITPENAKNNEFLTFEFSATYTSTYSNMATYMLGLIFGYIYFLLENRVVFTSKISVVLWWAISITLPATVVIISSYQYSRIMSAFLAGVLRSAYALGIGIAIFGMSQKIGGFLKAACEWRPVLFLGNFTYATYVVHFLMVFRRTAEAVAPIQVSDYILFISFLQDTMLSFLCGFFVHLLVEMPVSQLRSIFISKISFKYFKLKNNC